MSSENFKIGPCIVSYKGSALGATRDGIDLNLETDTIDLQCDQTYGQQLDRVVTGIKLSISLTLLEIDANFALLLDDNGRIATDRLGSRLTDAAGELLLTPLAETDTAGYRLPCAVLEPDAAYHAASQSPHTLKLKFTAWPDADGIMIEKVAVNG
jgi:hypothetical protein